MKYDSNKFKRFNFHQSINFHQHISLYVYIFPVPRIVATALNIRENNDIFLF